jgi:GDPmannose 4,6-dehydratase
MTNKTAVITGISGQDGSYLAEYLLSLPEYTKVIGIHRRLSNNNGLSRTSHLLHNPKFLLEEGDLTDSHSVCNIIKKYSPHEFYNLAAQSHVGTSFKQPNLTFSTNTGGVVNILENLLNYSPHTKLYQASTSEMFGQEFSAAENHDLNTIEKFQDETTPFKPQSPYGASKLASHHLVRIYREGYNLFGCCGILFNHESPRRGVNFVTKKITNYIGMLQNNLTNEKLKLGNLNSCRDWGHAKDYVRAMHLMLQQNIPDDFVISTGSSHSIKEFLSIAFNLVNKNYEDYVEIDSEFIRPAEVDYLRGRSTKAYHILGWQPQISFEQLVQDMVDYDVKQYAHSKYKKVVS